jgi:hypothetical protein
MVEVLMNKRRHRRRGGGFSTENSPSAGSSHHRSHQQRFSPIAPAPLKPLSKIRQASPCGSGLNPLAPSKQEAFAQYRKKDKKSYGIIFFESFQDAKKQKEAIQAAAVKFDQLNVVIKAEGDMDDQEILVISQKIKLFAGAAWTLIHERRMSDGWYSENHE